MLVSTIKEKDLTVALIDKLLYADLQDTRQNADCIVVLGSMKAAKYRVPVAVDAYKTGRSHKILLCGGKVRDFPDGSYSEARHMRRAALAMGVAQEDVILEESSQNTIENLLFALAQLQRAFWLNNLHSVLLVTNAYHMRRSLELARYLFPKHITVLPCPAPDAHTRRDNWMDTPVGVKRAKDEAMNLVNCVRNGVIPDFEI